MKKMMIALSGMALTAGMASVAAAGNEYPVVVQTDLQKSTSVAVLEVIGTSAPDVSDRNRRGLWRTNWYHSMIDSLRLRSLRPELRRNDRGC